MVGSGCWFESSLLSFLIIGDCVLDCFDVLFDGPHSYLFVELCECLVDDFLVCFVELWLWFVLRVWVPVVDACLYFLWCCGVDSHGWCVFDFLCEWCGDDVGGLVEVLVFFLCLP